VDSCFFTKHRYRCGGQTTRQVVMAVKYSAAGALVCTDCDAGKQEAL